MPEKQVAIVLGGDFDMSIRKLASAGVSQYTRFTSGIPSVHLHWRLALGEPRKIANIIIGSRLVRQGCQGAQGQGGGCKPSSRPGDGRDRGHRPGALAAAQ